MTRESETGYRSIFENSIEGIFRTSSDGKLLIANPALAAFLGYDSVDDLITSVVDVGTQVWADPDDRSGFISELAQHGIIRDREFRFKRKDGSPVWVSLSTRAIPGPDGRVAYFEGFVEDISERKKTRTALEESEARYRSIFEESPNGIYRVALDGRILAANPALARILGYDSPEDLMTTVTNVGSDIWLSQEERDRYIHDLDRKGEARGFEGRFRRKDGTTTWLSLKVRLFRGPDGRPAYGDGFVEDINERKQAEEALQMNQRLLREVEGIGRVGGAEIDIATDRRTWTDGLFDIFEVGPGFELTFEKISRFFTPASRELYERALDRAIRSGEPLDLEAEIVTGLGHPRNLHIIGRVDPDNRKVYIIYQDVTEQIKSEREKLELRTERTHLARVLSVNEVSSSLAHEINQPLGAILNNAEALKTLLSRPKSEQKEFPDIVEDIIKDAQRAGDVIRKIRGVVKSQAAAPPEALSVNGLIDDVLSFLHNNLVLNEVALHLQLAPELPGVRGDRIRLQQVLLNLMTNALDAMRWADEKVLTVRSAKDGPDSIVVSIGDSGPGIDEADRAKLFDPFFTTKKDGLGLGLPICRSIIEEHGGRIWAEDGPGGGAVFAFSLKIGPTGAG